MPRRRLYELLVRALGSLAEDDAALVVPAFFLKVLAVDGYDTSARRLRLVRIRSGPLVAFDLLEGGALCRDCRRGRAMSPAALEMLRGMLDGGSPESSPNRPGPSASEVTELMTEAMESHLDRQIRSIRAATGDLSDREWMFGFYVHVPFCVSVATTARSQRGPTAIT